MNQNWCVPKGARTAHPCWRARAEIYRIAQENGIPTANADGTPVSGAGLHVLNALKKWIPGIKSLDEVTPEMARQAFAARKAAQPPTTPEIIQQRAAIQNWADELEADIARFEEEGGVFRGREAEEAELTPSQLRERDAANVQSVMRDTLDRNDIERIVYAYGLVPFEKLPMDAQAAVRPLHEAVRAIRNARIK